MGSLYGIVFVKKFLTFLLVWWRKLTVVFNHSMATWVCRPFWMVIAGDRSNVGRKNAIFKDTIENRNKLWTLSEHFWLVSIELTKHLKLIVTVLDYVYKNTHRSKSAITCNLSIPAAINRDFFRSKSALSLYIISMLSIFEIDTGDAKKTKTNGKSSMDVWRLHWDLCTLSSWYGAFDIWDLLFQCHDNTCLNAIINQSVWSHHTFGLNVLQFP